MKEIEEIDKEMVEFSRLRYKRLGENDSGLYTYYLRRVKANKILSNEDRKIIDYIVTNYPKETRIHEICAGAAQTSIVLGSQGYNVDCSEIDARRALYALMMAENIGVPLSLLSLDFRDIIF